MKNGVDLDHLTRSGSTPFSKREYRILKNNTCIICSLGRIGIWLEKQLSTTIKCHIDRLQSNQWHSEEETKTTTLQQEDKSTATKFLFLSKIIAKLEWTLRTTLQDKDQCKIPTHSGSNIKHRGSYMSAYVLLNLLNDLGKRDKM